LDAAHSKGPSYTDTRYNKFVAVKNRIKKGRG
jgi:hypothetical protein